MKKCILFVIMGATLLFIHTNNSFAIQQSIGTSVSFREATAINAKQNGSQVELSFAMSPGQAAPQLRRCIANLCTTFIPAASQLARLLLERNDNSPFSMQISYF